MNFTRWKMKYLKENMQVNKSKLYNILENRWHDLYQEIMICQKKFKIKILNMV